MIKQILMSYILIYSLNLTVVIVTLSAYGLMNWLSSIIKIKSNPEQLSENIFIRNEAYSFNNIVLSSIKYFIIILAILYLILRLYMNKYNLNIMDILKMVQPV